MLRIVLPVFPYLASRMRASDVSRIPDSGRVRCLGLLSSGLVLMLGLSLWQPASLRAQTERVPEDLPPAHSFADHVVISEVQVDGDNGTNDEFIELYNPMNSPILIEDWSIQFVSGGTSGFSVAKKNFEPGNSIPARGFFLIARSDKYNGAALPDMEHATISMRNDGGTLFLVSDTEAIKSATDASIVDKVAYGQASGSGSIYPEKNAAPAPGKEQSIERKAFYFSTADHLDGDHAPYGNGFDSDDNAADFVLRETSDPQNSASPIERCCTTVQGTITLQGRTAHSGVDLLLWPGAGLRGSSDGSGQIAIPNVPAVASQSTATYTVETTIFGYLAPRATLDLTTHLVDGALPATVTLDPLRLWGGDVNGDNQVNIFDLAIIGSRYDGTDPEGDVNGDGRVNVQDLAIASGNFGKRSAEVYADP